MLTDIKQLLPRDIYEAAIGAAAPSGANVFATIADVGAAAPTLLDVMNNGHVAQGDFGSNVVISSINNQLQINSLDQTTSFIAASSVHLNTTSLGATGFQVWALSDIAGIHSIKSDIAVGGAGTLTVEDTVSNKGFVYASDYSANFTALSLVDKGYSDTHLGGKDVTALITTPTVTQDGFVVTWDNTAGKYDLVASAGGNTIYTADDTLLGNRKVTQGGNYVWFEGGDFHIGTTGGTGVFNVDSGTDTGFITDIKRDKDAGVGGFGYKATLNPRGAKVETVRINSGNQHSVYNEWTIGDSRLSYRLRVSPNENILSLFDSSTGAVETARIGETESWVLPRSSSWGFGVGIASVNARMQVKGERNTANTRLFSTSNLSSDDVFTVWDGGNVSIGGITSPTERFSIDGGDVAFKGASLSTEFFFDYSANATVFGAGTTTNSKVNVFGDIETYGSSNGIIFEDRTTGQRTRFYVDNGVFSQENA